MGRDSRTKRYAEQIDQDAATAYMPIISGGTTDNLVKLNADGEGEDSGIPSGGGTWAITTNLRITGSDVLVDALIIGDGNDGSWKIENDGSSLKFYYRTGGTYVEVSSINYIP